VRQLKSARFILVGNLWAYAILILIGSVVRWLQLFPNLRHGDAQFALSAVFQGMLTLLGLEVAALAFRLSSREDTQVMRDSLVQAAMLEGFSAFIAAATSITLLTCLQTVRQPLFSALVVATIGLAVLSVINGMASFYSLFPVTWNLWRDLARRFFNVVIFFVTMAGVVLVAVLFFRQGRPNAATTIAVAAGTLMAIMQVVTLIRAHQLWSDLRDALRRLVGRH